MYNPYCTELKQVLIPCQSQPEPRGLLSGFSNLGEDDLLILLLIVLIFMDSGGEKNLPLLGALVYLLL